MSFYDLQDDARKKSWLLILYFAISVMLIVAAVDICVYISQIMGRNLERPGAYDPDWNQLEWATAITVGIIAIGSVYRYWKLRDGGRSVATMVGATPVDHDTKDVKLMRFVNVVEEMSIASGVPMPELYVMEGEEGINAFVAGYGPADTVLVITNGSLQNFTRDELQGVIGHEFSHIFNGDTRLNMHIMAVLAGVMLISQLGGYLIRGVPWSEEAFYKNKNIPMFMPQPLLVFAGVIIWLIGSIGLVCGELIQAAISRQREYLADASAVQFTRNPTGLARALARIHDHVYGSRLSNFHAHELRHICIGETLRDFYEGMFNSHPPLARRIKAVDPSIYYAMELKDRDLREEYESHLSGMSTYKDEWVFADGLVPLGGDGIAALMNQPTQEHHDYARAMHKSIPDELIESLHTRHGARSAIYAMLMPGDERGRAEALVIIQEMEGRGTASQAERLRALMDGLGSAARLPILDLATPALRKLTREDTDRLISALRRLIGRDRKVTLFEYVLFTLARVRLVNRPKTGPRNYCHDISGLAFEAAVVVSAFARSGTADEYEAKSSFDNSMRGLGLAADAQPLTLEMAIRYMDRAMDGLERLAPKLKELLFGTLAECVMRDGQVMVAEGELLRAVAERLGSPMPPLVGMPRYVMDHPAFRGRDN